MKIKLSNAVKFEETLIRKGLSKRGFAKMANIADVTIIQITSGSRNPSPRTAKKICEALGAEFDELFVITE